MIKKETMNMKTWLMISFFCCVVALLMACGSDEVTKSEGPQAVKKTNSMKIYMHYMPWYQSKEVSGYWGSHWRMANKNPDKVDGTGKREIASHYYPLIGPYDSQDKDVIEYHLLLMKYAGIDVVLLDWYGTFNVNDYKPILTASNALIENLDEVGLQFGIVYEEYTAESVSKQTGKSAIEIAQADVKYMENNYFSKDEYVKVNDKPLLLTFGPRYFKQPSQWTQILGSVSVKPEFLPLWNHSGLVGSNNVSGEYAWVDFNSSLSELNAFYNRVTAFDILIGSAYPRFHDFYKEGGWGESYGNVPFNNGETLLRTLEKATDRKAKHLQLVTWNDFGEGTAIEPTLEDGFTCLEIIQDFTGVPYGKAELELIHTFFLKKKSLKGEAATAEKLQDVFNALVALNVNTAKEILSQLP